MSKLYNFDIKHWEAEIETEQQQMALHLLEQGNVLYLPQLAFQVSPSEYKFLTPNYVSPKAKNISFNVHTNQLSGAQGNSEELQELKALVQRFHEYAVKLIINLFPRYQPYLELGRTSYRAIEVKQRKTSYRKDDSRLHVDAFPATPNQGRRILRLFSNINPTQDRVWRIGEPFNQVAQRFLPELSKPFPGSATLLNLLGLTKTKRTEYDHIMLQLHNAMKADEKYQQQATQTEVRFPPHSSWIVQTDEVSHAAMSGQYLLEQTFYLPITAMLTPRAAPLKILEQMLGRDLVQV